MKKKLKQIGTGMIALALVIVTSCSQDEIFVQSKDSVLNPEENPYAYSKEEAEEVLTSFMAQYNSNASGGVSTRSGFTKTIKDVQALRVNKEEIINYANEAALDIDISSDALMYISNFEDNQGFAVMSADKRAATPVLAIIDEGGLDVDTLSKVNNPGFLIFLESASRMLIHQIAENNDGTKTYDASAALKDLSRNVETRATTLVNIPARLQTRWGQWLPYSHYCPNGCPTGCVITAAAQALSHFKTVRHITWNYNGMYGSSGLNWDLIISAGENNSSYGTLNTDTEAGYQVANLMFHLGIAIDAKYSPDGTGAKTDDALYYLKHWCGLTSSTGLRSYDRNGVRNALVNSPTSLIITEAYASKKTVLGITVGYGDGHTWIIDGAQQIYHSSNDIRDYVHCNWGWNGDNDGFYLSDGFSVAGRDYKYENKYAILNY